jgi:hypothetical protein
MRVGVMKDYKQKLRNLHASHYGRKVYFQQNKKAKAECKNCKRYFSVKSREGRFFFLVLTVCDQKWASNSRNDGVKR